MDESGGFVSTKLVEKVQSLSKKPTLDTNIRGILAECLKNVERQSLYLENGIFNFNLAEVAIVLEHVTMIYGKKVDLLWDLLLNYQKRLLKFNTQESKTAEEEKLIEERIEKYKRRRRKKTTEPNEGICERVDMKRLLPQLSIEYNAGVELSLKQKVWADFAQYPTDPEKDPVDRYLRPFFVATSYPIHIDGEYLCDNAQILSNHYYYETWDFIRQAKHNYLGEDVGGIGYDLEEDLTQTFLVERKLKFIDLTAEQTRELKAYIEKELLERLPLQQRCKRLCPRRSSIMLTRLSQDLMEKYLKKDRSIDEMSSDNQSFVTNDSGISMLDLNSTRDNNDIQPLMNANKSEQHIEHIETNNEEQLINSNIENVPETTESIVDINIQNEVINTANDSDNARNEADDGFIDNNMELEEPEIDNEENSIPNRTVEVTIRKNKEEKQRKTKKKIIDEDDVEVPKKRLRRNHDTFKLRKVITRPLGEFEVFFYENYKPHSEEGRIVITDFIRNIYLKQSKELKNQNVTTKLLSEYEMFYYKNYNLDDEEGTSVEPTFPEVITEDSDNLDSEDRMPLTQDSGICSNIDADLDESDDINEDIPTENDGTIVDDNVAAPAITSTPVLNKPSSTNAIDMSIMESFKRQNDANQKYFEWKKDVDSMLAATDKMDFDIHEYGSKVLDMLPNNEPVKINKLMKGKKRSEVARLFLASLQLINTSNVAMSAHLPGELANDTLQLQLLSRDRHHEHLESYMAPSLENRAVALQKIINIHRSQPGTSRDSHNSPHVPCKRKKFT